MSTFNVQQYQKDKETIVKQIKELLPDWQTTQGFVIDGLIDPDHYTKVTPKILCIFSESYGWAEMVATHGKLAEIEKQKAWLDGTGDDLLGISSAKVKIPRYILSALWLLFTSLETGQLVSYDHFVNQRLFRRTKETNRILQNVVRRIGWINAKKASRRKGTGTKENYGEIYVAALNGKDVLRQQIESIKPDFLIICSNPAYDALFDSGVLGTEI